MPSSSSSSSPSFRHRRRFFLDRTDPAFAHLVWNLPHQIDVVVDDEDEDDDDDDDDDDRPPGAGAVNRPPDRFYFDMGPGLSGPASHVLPLGAVYRSDARLVVPPVAGGRRDRDGDDNDDDDDDERAEALVRQIQRWDELGRFLVGASLIVMAVAAAVFLLRYLSTTPSGHPSPRSSTTTATTTLGILPVVPAIAEILTTWRYILGHSALVPLPPGSNTDKDKKDGKNGNNSSRGYYLHSAPDREGNSTGKAAAEEDAWTQNLFDDTGLAAGELCEQMTRSWPWGYPYAGDEECGTLEVMDFACELREEEGEEGEEDDDDDNDRLLARNSITTLHRLHRLCRRLEQHLLPAASIWSDVLHRRTEADVLAMVNDLADAVHMLAHVAERQGLRRKSLVDDDHYKQEEEEKKKDYNSTADYLSAQFLDLTSAWARDISFVADITPADGDDDKKKEDMPDNIDFENTTAYWLDHMRLNTLHNLLPLLAATRASLADLVAAAEVFLLGREFQVARSAHHLSWSSSRQSWWMPWARRSPDDADNDKGAEVVRAADTARTLSTTRALAAQLDVYAAGIDGLCALARELARQMRALELVVSGRMAEVDPARARRLLLLRRRRQEEGKDEEEEDEEIPDVWVFPSVAAMYEGLMPAALAFVDEAMVPLGKGRFEWGF